VLPVLVSPAFAYCIFAVGIRVLAMMLVARVHQSLFKCGWLLKAGALTAPPGLGPFSVSLA